jgi:superfamily II DNA/RNA helicase
MIVTLTGGSTASSRAGDSSGASRADSRPATDRLALGGSSYPCVGRRIPPETRSLLSTFEELGALPEIAEPLRAVGIIEAFPIQEMTLPIALTGTDLIGQARTGTGKTLAFAIPILQRVISPHDPDYEQLAAPGHPQALVIAPTRELALQVTSDIVLAGSKRGTRTITVYGGVPYETQLEALVSGVDIVVGTPGRLLDLANRRALDLSHVKVLVLDEADEMLDLGFLPDVEKLIARTPAFRQTMLFSATMRGEVVALARTHMRHPVNIRAESSSEAQTVPATAQFVYQTHDLDKPEVIARILQAENSGLTIIFTRTKRQAQRVADDMAERGFSAAALHGDMVQVARERAMARFREGKVQVLVATDVAARGIDVEAVTHVINYTCPDDELTYVHRIGRTGRAGASGIAVTFVDWPDLTRWKVINRALELPYEEPQETYSTSPHLFHDLGIASDVKGRLVPPRPPDDATASESRSSRPPGGGARRSAAPARSSGGRQRTRTRSGNRVEPDRQQATTTAEPATREESAAEGTGQARRRRPRRRTRGGASPAEQRTDTGTDES